MTRKPPRDPPTEAGIKGPTSRAFARIGGVGVVACMHEGGITGGHGTHGSHSTHCCSSERHRTKAAMIRSRSDLVEEIRDPSRRQRRDSIGPCWGRGVDKSRFSGWREVCLSVVSVAPLLSSVWLVGGGWLSSATKQERGREVSAALASGGRALSEAAP